jgi:hypothetical protein
VRDPLDALRGTDTSGGRLGDVTAAKARAQFESLRSGARAT